jgi:ribosomal protein S8
MPNFDVDVDIDVNEFLSECDSHDIEEIIDVLVSDGYLKNSSLLKEGETLMETEFFKHCNGLKGVYMQISNEDLEIIEQIYKKYC